MYTITNYLSIVLSAVALILTTRAGVILEVGRRDPAPALVAAAVAAVVAIVAFCGAEVARKVDK